MHSFYSTLIGVGLVACNCAAAGSNLVTDGDFDMAAERVPNVLRTTYDSGQSIDGGFWNVTQGLIGVDAGDQYVFHGNGSLSLTIGTGLDAISQLLHTTAGQEYSILFFANADSTNQVSVLFDGIPVPSAPTLINQGAPPWPGTWTQYTATASTRSTFTYLTFEGISELPGQPGTFSVELDDISVTAIPEPAAIAVLSLASILVFRFRSPVLFTSHRFHKKFWNILNAPAPS
jgi:hypothetical protein